jgi:inner membrane protein
MASFGHFAVGMVTGRLHGGAGGAPARSRRCSWGTLLAFAALSMLPDADVVAVALGAPDVGAIGHRGASHSLFVAVVIGALCGVAARRLGWPVLRTAVAATLAIASHGILDAFGEGGRGIPLLWPLSDARFMSPLRLLPDAPRGLRFLSRRGLMDVALEFLVFFPFTAFALWPRWKAPLRLVVIDGAGAGARGVGGPCAPDGSAGGSADASEPPARSTG